MKTFFIRSILIIVILIVLAVVIWQPVLPSVLLLEKMAGSIDPQQIKLREPVTVRFELAGKGGGDYNLYVDSNEAKILPGDIEKVDLLIAMQATDFNELIFSLADNNSKGGESLFMSYIISNRLRFAGDMTVFKKIFTSKGVEL